MESQASEGLNPLLNNDPFAILLTIYADVLRADLHYSLYLLIGPATFLFLGA